MEGIPERTYFELTKGVQERTSISSGAGAYMREGGSVYQR